MRKICNGPIQYATAYFTREKKILSGDRRNIFKTKPNFELSIDETNKEIELKITDLDIEDMYAKPKERLDIYFLKEGALILDKGLNDIFSIVTSSSILDRSTREAKDVNAIYDNSGLPILIDSKETFIKIKSVVSNYASSNFCIQSIRKNQTQHAPNINIDLEHNNSRLHFGFELTWEKVAAKLPKVNYISAIISFSEYGHLKSAIQNAITKLK